MYADLLYGNGLRQGFANLSKLPPYYPINLGVEQKVRLSQTESVKLRFDIVNILIRCTRCAAALASASVLLNLAPAAAFTVA